MAQTQSKHPDYDYIPSLRHLGGIFIKKNLTEKEKKEVEIKVKDRLKANTVKGK